MKIINYNIDKLLPHMMIEFMYGENRQFGFYFGESAVHTTQMFEKYGVFNDCKSIAMNIINRIKNENPKNESYKTKRDNSDSDILCV